jgi:hypothetical protein
MKKMFNEGNQIHNFMSSPLPHGVLATFFPTAGGPMGPPTKDDISRAKTILMTSLRTHRAYALSSPGLRYTNLPLPPCAIERSLCPLGGTRSQLSRELF